MLPVDAVREGTVRRLLVGLVAAMALGCSAGPSVQPSPIQLAAEHASASPAEASVSVPPTIAPSLSPSPTIEPSASPSDDARLIAAALEYAREAGFEVAADPHATIDDQDPSFAFVDLRRVMLRQAFAELPIEIYVDRGGVVRAVGEVVYTQPLGERVSERRALRLAARYLSEVGVDVESGRLRVVKRHADVGWYITLQREIEGYPVANMPMAWWIDGDKVYAAIRPDGRLSALYAVPVEARTPVPPLLDEATLIKRLAAFAERPRREIRDLADGFYWVQPRYRGPDDMDAMLTLGYCATDRGPRHWMAWCVDAETGEPIARGEAYD